MLVCKGLGVGLEFEHVAGFMNASLVFDFFPLFYGNLKEVPVLLFACI